VRRRKAAHEDSGVVDEPACAELSVAGDDDAHGRGGLNRGIEDREQHVADAVSMT
jgi:hypothetical protein